jgi:uncharacterized membrane protein
MKREVSKKKFLSNILQNTHPEHRVLISLGITALTYLCIRDILFQRWVQASILWDVFALSYCSICGLVFFTRTCAQIRQHAKEDDGSRLFVYLLILLSSFASMLTVFLLFMTPAAKEPSIFIVVIVGILLSWMMVHISFTFHYAHLYYTDDNDNTNIHAGGLDFPNEKKPDYIDFAYFSFIIGMTFQVSDVEITSRRLRRLVLLHSLLSFGLNTFVVALTINLIAGLKG